MYERIKYPEPNDGETEATRTEEPRETCQGITFYAKKHVCHNCAAKYCWQRCCGYAKISGYTTNQKTAFRKEKEREEREELALGRSGGRKGRKAAAAASATIELGCGVVR